MPLLSSAAAEDDDNRLLLIIPLLVLWVGVVLVAVSSLVITARRCSRLWKQHGRLRGGGGGSGSGGAAQDDDVCKNLGFDERSVKRLHQQTYREMTKEVNELRHIQAEVRSQLKTLKKVVEKMKEERLPRVQGLSKSD